MNDLLILLILPVICIIIGVLLEGYGKEHGAAGAGFVMGLVIFTISCMITVLYAIGKDSEDTWNNATIYQTIPASEIKTIELPDKSISLWVGEKEIYSIKSLKDFSRIKQISRIEFREKEIFGPDYNRARLIFEDGTYGEGYVSK